MLPEPIASSLAAISQRLEGKGIPFCVGGSVLLRLSDFEVAVGDIDIVVDEASRRTIDLVFPEQMEREPCRPWESGWAIRAAWRDGPTVVQVDVMGGLGLWIGGELGRFPVEVERVVSVGDARVPLAPIRHWYHLYRVHAPAKAEMIRSRLSDSEVARGAAELGIAAGDFPYTGSAKSGMNLPTT